MRMIVELYCEVSSRQRNVFKRGVLELSRGPGEATSNSG
jgi:hypothetical protein